MNKTELLILAAKLKAEGKNPHGLLRDLLIDLQLDEQEKIIKKRKEI